jgi:outer membrane receptor protein involved in Fe transport
MHWLEQPKTPRVDELVPGFGQVEPSSSEYVFAPNERLYVHAEHSRKAGPLGLDWDVDLAWQRIVDDRRTRDFEATIRTFEANRSDLYGASIKASGRASGTSWTAGAELYYDEVRSGRDELDLLTGLSRQVPPRFPDDSSVRQLAVFGGFVRPVGKAHKISGGLRFNDIDIALAEHGTLEPTSIDTHRWSGDLGWIYDASEYWQLAVNLGFGFRAPNIFDLGTLGNRPGNRFNVPSAGLEPETVVHGDLGLRYRAEHSGFELVVFALDYNDRITSVLTGDVTADGRDVVQSENAASATIHGVEFGFDAELGKAVRVSAIAAYTWGEQRLSGDIREPGDRIPPLSGRLGVGVAGKGDWTFEGWIDWAGAQDRLSARDVRDVRINPSGSPGWTSIGARAVWAGLGDWQLTMGLQNMLDKRYRVHGSGIDEPGRSIVLRANVEW